MMHLVTCISDKESSRQGNSGSNQITSEVNLPENEKKCVLPFQDKSRTQLDDIIFLLTIFTGRNVFKKDWNNDDFIVIQDHRQHNYGGQLRCSIEYESIFQHIDTKKIIAKEELGNNELFNYNEINIGFEKTINSVLKLISSDKWQEKFEGGYFLFLYKSAIQRQIIETSFTTCWTIWEHLFAIHNRYLDKSTILNMSGDNKISFILYKFFDIKVDDTAKKNIRKMTVTRNRLIHFGKKTEGIDYKEMEMFIRLTEQLISIILGLKPSNIFNSLEALTSFLTKQPGKC